MLILRDSSVFPLALQGGVVALGNFDGLHLGHRAVINEAIALARQTAKPAGLITFEPHPRRIFRPDLATLRILPLAEKLHLLRDMKLDFVRIIRFTRTFAKTTAEDFVSLFLRGQMQISHVITGEDFVFGHNRIGDAKSLQSMAHGQGFAATACAAVAAGGMRCSSTRIREALAAGEVGKASELLGRPYRLTGHVQHGEKRGRILGFPTANIYPPPVFLPLYGVYAVRVKVKDKIVSGVANLGLRPTFGGSRVRLEVHLFNWQEDIYGEYIEVELIRHIRPEQKFNGPEALKVQIAEDCDTAKRFL